MGINGSGELAALGAVAGWTVSATSFESAGRRVGSLPVNVIRLAGAAVILVIWGFLRGTTPWPEGIRPDEAIWLLLSGFVGFFLGDLVLFRSFLLIGSRLAMLVMSLSPPISALLDRLVFGVRLEAWDGAGMLLTMAGVALAVTGGDEKGPTPGKIPAIGLLLALGGALGQSGGMILGKLGLANHDPMAATFVRSVGGLVGFIPLVLLSGATRRVVRALRDGPAMARTALGTIGGPVLGVSALLLALRWSPAGVVSAITAIVPITIIPISHFLLKEKIRPREIIGAVIAVAGVAVLFLT